MNLPDWLSVFLTLFLFLFLLFVCLLIQSTFIQHLQLSMNCAGASNIPMSKTDIVPTFLKRTVA